MMKKILATAMLYGIGSFGIGGDLASSYYKINKFEEEVKSSFLERKIQESFIELSNSSHVFDFKEFDSYLVEKGITSEIDVPLQYAKYEYMERKDVRRIVDSLYSKINVPSLISKDFFMTAVENESRFNKNAISPVGARGLAQIMPKTWNQYNPEHDFEDYSFNPVLNLKTGLEVYKNVYYFVKNHNPNWENLSEEEKLSNIIAGYNWGIGKLKHEANWDLARLPDETKGYIKYVFEKLS